MDPKTLHQKNSKSHKIKLKKDITLFKNTNNLKANKN